MGRKFLCLALVILILSIVSPARATTGLDWAFFKNYISPAWVWGENGLITMPIAETLGKGRIGLSFNGIDSGKLQGEQLLYSTVSLQIGTSSDVELGYSKKFLLYKWMRTDIEGETFHMKVKILDVDEYAPKVSVGTVAFALTNKTNYSTKDMFFDIFLVASQKIAAIRLHLGYEFGMVGQASSKPFFFAGTDIPLGPLTIIGEYVGSDKDGYGGIFNAGLSFRPANESLILSVAAAGIGQSAGSRYMVQSSLLF